MAKTKTTLPAGPNLCPVCGSRVGSAATRCLVCGADLAQNKPGQVRAGNLGRKPLSLAQVGLIIGVILLLIVGGIFLAISLNVIDLEQIQNPPTDTPTATVTVPPTSTGTPVPTETPAPTETPLPPREYVVQTGDTCLAIAFNLGVSVNSIVTTNPVLGAACQLPPPGQTILVPYPTPTASPFPTATLSGLSDSTAVPRVVHTVVEGDNLAAIARRYGISVEDIVEVNGLPSADVLQLGRLLVIPIERAITPGPTSTPTPFPPYPPANLLVPADGQAFAAGEPVTLQWVSVGELRPGEGYQVSIEDVTCQCARTWTAVVADTRYGLPSDYQPQDDRPHVYRWSVIPVRIRPGTEGPNAVYDPASDRASAARTFIWQRGATTP